MFNKETEYALRGLVYIKLQNIQKKRPGTAEVAKEIEAPHFYTAKILQRLVRAGFLESLKGKGGGFYFDPDKPELILRELISSIEGNTSFTGCGFGLKQCSEQNPCPVHNKYAPIRESINKLVSEETVQSLAIKVYKDKLKADKKKKQ
jgi:Rrf2 family protein